MTRKQSTWGVVLMFVCLLVLTLVYYDSVLDKGPLNTHIWRQTDCLSMTKKYQEGAALHEPQMHVLFGDAYTSGKSAGEFPLLYYVVGNIWKITGESFMVYRIVYLIILLCGLLAFFRSLQLIFNSNFWSISLTLLLFSSPVFAFYSVSFLTDAPAFSFTLIGLYFFTLYQIKQKHYWIYFFAFFIALGGLSKISMLIAFVFLGFIYLLELIPRVKVLAKRQLFYEKKHSFIAMFLIVAAVAAWYIYVYYYNEAHDFKYTFNHAFPFWKETPEKLAHTWLNMKTYTIPVFFSLPLLFLLLLVFLINLVMYKKMNLFAYLGNLIITVGAATYFVLWGPLFGVHDYYLLALLILFVGILIPFMTLIPAESFKNVWVKSVFGIFLLYNILYCAEVMKFKTLKQDRKSFIVHNQRFKEAMIWTNWQVSVSTNNFYFCRDYLKEIGIKSNDKVYCYPDISYNTSLFLMDRDGWTNMRMYKTKAYIEYLLSKDLKFIVIQGEANKDAEFLQPYLKNEIGRFEDLIFYKV